MPLSSSNLESILPKLDKLLSFFFTKCIPYEHDSLHLKNHKGNNAIHSQNDIFFDIILLKTNFIGSKQCWVYFFIDFQS